MIVGFQFNSGAYPCRLTLKKGQYNNGKRCRQTIVISIEMGAYLV
jgi:hypothetical protein